MTKPLRAMPGTDKPNGDATSADAAPTTGEASDPFDTSSLHAYDSPIGARVFRTAIPARSTRPHEFFRSCPDPAYTRTGLGLTTEIDGRNETCWLAPTKDLLAACALAHAEPFPLQVFTVMVHPDLIILWPQKLPVETSARSGSSWHYSALRILDLARGQWVRKIANRATNVYDYASPVGDLGEPQWPAEPLSDLMRLAFTGDRLIDNVDHPVLRRLRGEL